MRAIDTASEEWRRICEARYWLRQGYTTADRVEDLLARIRKRRGCAAAELLRADMRAEWANRAAWLAAEPEAEA